MDSRLGVIKESDACVFYMNALDMGIEDRQIAIFLGFPDELVVRASPKKQYAIYPSDISNLLQVQLGKDSYQIQKSKNPQYLIVGQQGFIPPFDSIDIPNLKEFVDHVRSSTKTSPIQALSLCLGRKSPYLAFMDLYSQKDSIRLDLVPTSIASEQAEENVVQSHFVLQPFDPRFAKEDIKPTWQELYQKLGYDPNDPDDLRARNGRKKVEFIPAPAWQDFMLK